MAHVTKYAMGAVGHLTRHYERGKQGVDGEPAKYRNQDIDLSRSWQNYNLAPEHEGGQRAFIERRLGEVRHLNRADVNVMCSWVVTMPKQFECIGGDGSPDEAERLFFQRVYSFLTERYGRGNVISAYVHKDEVSPHMHFSFVPCVPDRRRGGLKVSAKEVLTKQDLQAFHNDLEAHLDGFGDWRFEILNGATKDGNRAVEELKRKSASERLNETEQTIARSFELAREKLNEQWAETQQAVQDALRTRQDALGDVSRCLDVQNDMEDKRRALEGILSDLEGAIKKAHTEHQEALKTVQKLQEDINHLLKRRDAVQGKLDDLQAVLSGRLLSLKEVQDIQPQKTISGALKGVSVDQIEGLKRMAMEYHGLRARYLDLREQYKKDKAFIPSMDERLRAIKDKERLAVLENAVAQLPDKQQREILGDFERGKSKKGREIRL